MSCFTWKQQSFPSKQMTCQKVTWGDAAVGCVASIASLMLPGRFLAVPGVTVLQYLQ